MVFIGRKPRKGVSFRSTLIAKLLEWQRRPILGHLLSFRLAHSVSKGFVPALLPPIVVLEAICFCDEKDPMIDLLPNIQDHPSTPRRTDGLQRARENMKYTVLIADDHGVVRKGLRLLLEQYPELAVIGEAANGREAVTMAVALAPQIVVLDVAMPILNGIEAAEQILRVNSKTGIIILTMHADESYLLRALNVGVKGYLLKESAEEDLLLAIRAVANGKPFFSRAINETLLEDYVRMLKQQGLSDTFDLLTAREKEVLQLLAEGKTNKEVAQLLDVSPYTVESHRTNLMQKLAIHNTAEIVLYAVRKRLVS
jgi:RNA polymerase sigma factor (sigma-70 family)